MKKILLVQTAFLGDVVLATPLIAALQKLYPAAQVWVLTTPAGKQLLQHDPRIAGIITFDKRSSEAGLSGLRKKAEELRSYDFDKVYSLHKSWRTSLLLWLASIPVRIGFRQAMVSFLYTDARPRAAAPHEVLRNLSLMTELAESDRDDAIRLYAPRADALTIDLAAVVREHAPYITIFPGSAWHTKRWSHDGYKEVVARLSRQGRNILLLGSEKERPLCESIAKGTAAKVFAGEINLSESLFLVQHAAAMVANDSLALHLASAFSVPTVAIFCATSPSFGFGPWKNRHSIIEKEGLSCRPCARHGGHVCPVGTESCIRGISPETVTAAIEKMI